MEKDFDMRRIASSLDAVRGQGLVDVADRLESRIRRAIKSRDFEIARLKNLFTPRQGGTEPSGHVSLLVNEANPGKSSLERVLCRLSICTTTREPTGATARAEITEAEFAGMLAGMECGGDRLLRELAELIAWAYLEYPDAMGRLIVHLDTWGRQRVLFRAPDLAVTGKAHQQVARAVILRHIKREATHVPDFRAASGISERKWPAWRPWVQALTERVTDADSALAQHLSAQLSRQNVEAEA